jgi:hypothetical protein
MPTISSSAVDWSRESEQSPLLSPQNAPDKISTNGWIVKGSAASWTLWILTATCATFVTRWMCWTFSDQTLRLSIVDSASIMNTPSHYPAINRVNETERMESRNAAQFSYQRAKVCVAEDKQGFPSFWNFGGQAIRVSYDARSILLNEERVLLLGGSMHPSRSTPHRRRSTKVPVRQDRGRRKNKRRVHRER